LASSELKLPIKEHYCPNEDRASGYRLNAEPREFTRKFARETRCQREVSVRQVASTAAAFVAIVIGSIPAAFGGPVSVLATGGRSRPLQGLKFQVSVAELSNLFPGSGR
jgi:hypothetical protein